MRTILFGAAVTFAACSQPAAAEPDLLIASDPGEILAEQIRGAIASHDQNAILDLAKWDGVREEHRAIFRDFVVVLVEQDIKEVFLEPLGADFAPFEYQGVLYAKNGEAVGQVTVSFTVEPPTTAEYLHWPYAVENGRAVILLDAPVTIDVAG